MPLQNLQKHSSQPPVIESKGELRSRYEITWSFIFISLRLLMPFQLTDWALFFFYNGLILRLFFRSGKVDIPDSHAWSASSGLHTPHRNQEQAGVQGHKLLDRSKLPLSSLYPLAELSALFAKTTGDDEVFFFLRKVVEL